MKKTRTKMPDWLIRELKDNPALADLKHRRGRLPVNNIMAEALIISASYAENTRPILVVKKNLYHAQRFYERISSFLKEDQCALFGSDESLRVEAIAASPEMRAAKVDTLSSLLVQPDQVVVTCPSALLRFLPKRSTFERGCLSLKVNDEADPEDIRRRLRAGGYSETSHVDQPLSFASRGEIIDIYSINYENPIRIEFFDTVIESIRFFDLASQKTINTIDEVRIVPASDVLFDPADMEEIRSGVEKVMDEDTDLFLREQTADDLDSIEQGITENGFYPYLSFVKDSASIIDYMDHPLVLLSEEREIRDNIKKLNQETAAYIMEMVSEGKMLKRYTMWHDFDRIAEGCTRMITDYTMPDRSGIREIDSVPELLDVKIRMINRPGRKVLVLNEHEKESVTKVMGQYFINWNEIGDHDEVNEGFSIYQGELPQGFAMEDRNLMVYSSREIFDVTHHAGRYEKKFQNAEVISSFDELNPGDYVVHAKYGVGQYIGIETRDDEGVKRDFIKIAYRGNASLYVPLEHFQSVRKFVSREGVVPRLNKIGSNEWEKTKAKIRKDVGEIADRLVRLYSVREEHIGHAFSPDSDLMRKFESEFPYELTPDQAKAVQDVKRDMENSRPMDRLICGDVGFGKTEIAVRASFKAVQDGYQTAVLCPTTILAEQHFKTFSSRYEGYPVTIRVLDRFQPAEEVRKTLEGLQKGTVDIVIGTHRLLSKDIKFSRLGLLVVDEEQRFGVEHKEKIKEMKNDIDVLTLSATPIPRTLQMSLIGIRQISQLETPPRNRYSIQTYVVENDDGLVADAIEKELARGGQVFYLYNNIERIYETAQRLRRMVKEAHVGIIHGKMDREDVENTMMQFYRHELDVMVCTTIVENGIDIPNANTIIVDNAQNFGLAQLYQIKGRVGRSDRVAYAYLMIPPGRILQEAASKRLQAIKDFASLGSGYKIAMRDIAIRGAGDLLGPHQSGFIDTVGIDMYIEMLNEAITERKTGKKPEEKKPAKSANVAVTRYIPEGFSPDDYDRLDFYTRINSIRSLKELKEMKNEVVDQYGRLPKQVEALFTKKHLDLLVNEPYVDSLRQTNEGTVITFSSLFSQTLDGVKVFEKMYGVSKDIRLRYASSCMVVTVPKVRNVLPLCIQVIETMPEAKKEK